MQMRARQCGRHMPGRRLFRAFNKPEIAKQIQHHCSRMLAGLAKLQAGQRADLLHELARYASVDGVMTGIMRTRRDFVHEQGAVPQDKEFNAQHANIIQLFSNRARCILCANGYIAVAPSAPRAISAEISSAMGSCFSMMHATWPSAA